MVRLAFALTFLSSAAGAADLPAATETCSTWREFGRGVMISRQVPKTIEEALTTWTSPKIVGEAGVEAARKAVFAAYDTPRFLTPEAQERAISSFGEQIERECYRSLGF